MISKSEKKLSSHKKKTKKTGVETEVEEKNFNYFFKKIKIDLSKPFSKNLTGEKLLLWDWCLS
jgi:hypothetical protein